MGKIRQLIINPGSTSTKIAVYDDEEMIFDETLRHNTEELKDYKKITDQFEFRMDLITKALEKQNIQLESFDSIVGRGGLLKPIPGGTYEVNEELIKDLYEAKRGEHASNLGGILADAIGKKIGRRAFIVDPVVVDENEDLAKITGLKGVDNQSIWHALNQKAIARRYAKEVGKKYNEINVIVAHLGGGVSVAAHKKGLCVGAPDALYGFGAMSPERCGTLPVGELIRLCYSGKYTYEQMKKKLAGEGGLVSHLGTNSAKEAEDRYHDGDEYAGLILEALAYQVAKDIGAQATILKGEVEAILITGGLAYSKDICQWIEDRVSYIAPVKIYPGEDELLALCQGGLRVMNGEEEAKVYA